MKYRIDKDAPRSAYMQLYTQLREDIVTGAIPRGSKLPSKRLLAGELGVSLITVEHAYDTLECPLADVEGHWYGKRTGRYVDSRFVFRRHVIFPRSGRYHFELWHGMRDTNVTGLKSVGLRIEKFGTSAAEK